MDRCLSNDDIEPNESIPSASDPVLPMSHCLPEFNSPNYHDHSNKSIPSASDPVLPMSHCLPEFNSPNYHDYINYDYHHINYDYHHHSNYHELVDDFSYLQLSSPSLPSLHYSSIPSSSSSFQPLHYSSIPSSSSSFQPLHYSSIPSSSSSSSSFQPQERNSPSSRPFYIACPFCNHQFPLDINSYSKRVSKFLMPPRSPPVNEVSENIVSMKQFLSTERPEDIALIYSMVLSDMAAVMVDFDGSSLFQKLLELCSHNQRLDLLDAIIVNINTLLDICCNDYG